MADDRRRMDELDDDDSPEDIARGIWSAMNDTTDRRDDGHARVDVATLKERLKRGARLRASRADLSST